MLFRSIVVALLAFVLTLATGGRVYGVVPGGFPGGRGGFGGGGGGFGGGGASGRW